MRASIATSSVPESWERLVLAASMRVRRYVTVIRLAIAMLSCCVVLPSCITHVVKLAQAYIEASQALICVSFEGGHGIPVRWQGQGRPYGSLSTDWRNSSEFELRYIAQRGLRIVLMM